MAAAVLPVIVAATVAIVVLIEDQQRLIEADYRADATAILAAVDGELLSQIEMAERLAKAPRLAHGDLAAFYEYAKRSLLDHPSWAHILLVDPASMTTVMNTGRPFGTGGQTVVEPDSVREAVRTGYPVVGLLSKEPGGRFLVPLRVPVIRDGEVRYVVTVLLHPSRVTDIVSRQDAEDRIVAVLDRAYTLVARTGGDQYVGQHGTSTPDTSLNSILIGPGKDGRQYARVLVRSETTEWMVGVGTTVEMLSNPLNTRIMVIAIVAVAAAMLSIGAVLYVGRRIRRVVLAEEHQRRQELHDAYTVAKEATRAAKSADAEKSRFLAAVSHDLRQPIQAMQNLTHLLSQRVRAEEERRLVNQLQNSIGASAALLNALLDISKLDAGAIQPQVQSVDLDTLLSDIVAEFQPSAETKGLRIVHVPTRHCVGSDPVLLGSIVRNLVSNAIRYTPAGRVLVGCRRQGGQVRLEVWDTGIGIPPENQHDIFAEFHQVGNAERDRDKGYGLGLAIVDRLSRLLHHPIGLRSVPSRGTVVWITLPLAEGGAPLPMRADAVPERSSGKRILIVEDDAIQAYTAAMMMEDWGYHAEITASVAEAEARIKTFVPDVIVSDFRLRGGVDGLEVIRRLRALLKAETCAILTTGETSLSDRATRVGVRVLYKPYTPEQLQGLIEELLQSETCAAPLPEAY